MMFTVAWRNIWRNKRRSLITMSSIFFAVFLAILMRSFQPGSYAGIINTIVEMYSGYIQIEHKDFPEDKTIDNSIEYFSEIIAKIQSVENVKTVVPRLASFSFAYSKNQSKGVLFAGINPENENQMTGLIKQLAHIKTTQQSIDAMIQKNVPRGIINKLLTIEDEYYSNEEILAFDLELNSDEENEYLPIIKETCAYESEYITNTDNGVLIGAGLANYLKLNVGESIILMGMGYYGISAAGVFPVKGILKLPNPKLNDMAVYGALPTVQNYFSAYRISENSNDITFLLSSYATKI